MRQRHVAVLAAGLALVCLQPPLSVLAGPPVTLDNLSFELGPTHYRIPHLEAEGVALSAADLARLFGQGLAAGLERLSASRVAIPEIVGETGAGGAARRLVYKDVVLENVIAGRIGAMRAASLEQAVERSGASPMQARYGGIALAGVDLKQLFHVATAARSDAAEAPKPIEESASLESAVFSYPDERFELRFGRTTAAGLKARALSEGWPKLLERLSGASAPDGAAFLAVLAEAAGSIEIGAIETRDVFAGGMAGGRPYSIKAGRLALGGLAQAAAGEALCENIALESADGGLISLRRLFVKGLDIKPLLSNEGAGVPAFTRLELRGLAADLPDAGAGPGRVKFALAGAEADLSDYIDGLPTRAAARMDHFFVDLAGRGEIPATAQFRALGYRDIDISGSFAGEWRPKDQEASIDSLRLDARDMGRVDVSASFGGVSPALWSRNELLAQVAAASARIRRFELRLEGGELLERVLAQEAGSRGGRLDRLREDYARDGGRLVAALLGDGEKAKAIGKALAGYLRDPKRFELRLASKNGVGALDVLARSTGEILNDVEVEALAPN